MDWYEILPRIINMTLTGSVTILVVLIARLLLKKAPKIYSYILWIAVLFRLLSPVSISLDIPILNSIDVPVQNTTEKLTTIEYVPSNIVHTENPKITTPISFVDEIVNDTLPQKAEQLTADPLEAPITFATYGWMLGMIIMVIYSIVSGISLKRKLTGMIHLRENIYYSDYIDTPFVIGIICPKIILPSSLNEKEIDYIILHEKTHIKRLDHLFKALSFAALILHWFNPLVWLAFVLSGKDMEMSCDEAVIKKMGNDIRSDYAASLLSLQSGRRIIAGMPLAFIEKDTESRIKNLSRFRKPVIWISIITAVLVIILGFLLLINPVNKETEVMGAVYSIDEVLYAVTVGDEISTEPPHLYTVTADYQLYVQDKAGEDWYYLGALIPYNLTNEELDEYTPVELIKDKYSISQITDSYILRIENDNFYLVFKTRSGNTYLGYGWEDVAERNDALSDDTRLRRLYLLENTLGSAEFNGGFFNRSLEHQIQKKVDSFAYMISDEFKGYAIVGFMSNGISQSDMTDLGYAVFKKSENGYKLLNWHVYSNAAIEGNGIYYCSDPAVFNETGELRPKDTYDVILSVNENLETIKRVYHYKDKEDLEVSQSYLGNKSMTLFCWDKEEAGSSVSQYYIDEEGKKIEEYEYSNESSIPSDESLDMLIEEAALEYHQSKYPDGLIKTESHHILATEVNETADSNEVKTFTVYAIIMVQEYSPYAESADELVSVTGSCIPTALTFMQTSKDSFTLEEYWIPRDGSYYKEDLDNKFPVTEWDETIYSVMLDTKCRDKAMKIIEAQGDMDEIISNLFEKIIDGSTSSNPSDYIEMHSEEVNTLINYRQMTLVWCFREFLKGNNTDLRGAVMQEISQRIIEEMGEAQLEIEASNGQMWFDEFSKNAVSLLAMYNEEQVKKHYPASWLLIEIVNSEDYQD